MAVAGSPLLTVRMEKIVDVDRAQARPPEGMVVGGACSLVD